MSGGNFSVVTQIPRLLNPFSTKSSLSSSSLADSPEACEDPEGLVTLPGGDTDIQIRDIPIVTDGGAGTDMLYMKTVTPAVTIPPRYLNSTCSSPDTSSLDITCPPSVTRDFDHMYASLTKGDNILMAENVHLREMLVSQLDLIQQQSETILSKDKQLKQLREENGLLVQRLSRMERRCRGDTTTPASSSERKQHGGVSQSGVKKRSRDSDTNLQDNVKKKKVDTDWSEQSSTVSQECVDTLCNDEFVDEIMGDMITVSRPGTPASVASVDTVRSESRSESLPKSSKKTSKKQSLEGKRKSMGSTTVKSEPPDDKEPKFKKTRTQADPVPMLETDMLYYVGCKNDILPNVDDHLDQVAALQRGVEVPSFREDKNHYNLLTPNKLCIKKDKAKETSWRIKSTNPVYSGDGAGSGSEDISDQTILKRHEKFEKDEKQRKRWDLQRLREEQQLQKLRARQEKQIGPTSSNKKDDITSLIPNIESASYIFVDDKIPVSAFGRPLPCLPQTSFSLPWFKSRHSQY